MQPTIKLILIYCVMGIMLPLSVNAQTFSENQIKAAFLYKITKFIRWTNQDGRVELCFLGEKEDLAGNTVGKTMDSLVVKEDSKFYILRNTNIKDIKNCHMLFIGIQSEPILRDILAALDNKPIVTISDIESFARRGGMFGFIEQDGNISVELNHSKARANGVNINSALQEMVMIVK